MPATIATPGDVKKNETGNLGGFPSNNLSRKDANMSNSDMKTKDKTAPKPA